MTTQPHEFTLHPSKSPEEMEEEIRHARSAISADLKELGEKLSPEKLKQGAREILRDAKEEATDMLRSAKDHAIESVSETMSELGDRARHVGHVTTDFVSTNAVPLALMGLGAGWLYMSVRNQRRFEEGEEIYPRRHGRRFEGEFGRSMVKGYEGRMVGEYEEGEFLGRGPSDAQDISMSPSQGSESSLIEQGKERAQAVKRRVKDVGHQMSERAGEMTEQARGGLRRAGNYTRDFSRENPVALGALAILAGVGIGLLLPATKPENRLMGSTRDRIVGGAKETAREVSRAAREGASEVKKSLTEPSVTR